MIDFLLRNWPWIVFLTVMLTMHSRGHGCGMRGHSGHDHHESHHENHRGTVSHDEDEAAGNAAKTEVPR